MSEKWPFGKYSPFSRNIECPGRLLGSKTAGGASLLKLKNAGFIVFSIKNLHLQPYN
jgi:hypothetical protein